MLAMTVFSPASGSATVDRPSLMAPPDQLTLVADRLHEILITGATFDTIYRHILAVPGKGVRAGLVLACARLLASAAAVPLRDAVDLACSMEMFHEASLVHDDICDGSLLRRDAPSVPRWKAKLEKRIEEGSVRSRYLPWFAWTDHTPPGTARTDGSSSARPAPAGVRRICLRRGHRAPAIAVRRGVVAAKTVDAGPHLATAPSVVIDVLLLALFGLQHSGMARPSFKAFITKWVPEALERPLYIVMASLAVWVLCLGWQPLPQRSGRRTASSGPCSTAGSGSASRWSTQPPCY